MTLRRAVNGAARSVGLWPALTAFVLGCLFLGRPEVWRDEIATWSAASRSLPELRGLLHNLDASTGAYYLMMHAWVAALGDSPIRLRLPSVLAMTGAAALVAVTGRRLFGYRGGWCAGMLFALIPAVSRYAQEARSYAFVVFGVALATAILVGALAKPRWWRWLAYAAAIAFVGLMHVVALAFVAGQFGVVLLWPGSRALIRRSLGWFVGAVAVGVLPVLPVVKTGLDQTNAQIAWIAKPTAWDVYTLGPMVFCSVAFVVFTMLAAAFAWGSGRRAAWTAAVMAVVPVVAVWAVSNGDTSYWLARYLLFTLPAWALIAGAGIAAARRPLVVALLLVVAAVAGLPDQQRIREAGSHDWWNYPAPPPVTPFRYSQAAATVKAHWQPGDGVVYPSRDSPYLMDLAMDYNLPSRIQLQDVFAERSAVQNDSFWATPYPGLPPQPVENRRLWVIWPGADPLYTGLGALDATKTAFLQAHYFPAVSWTVPGVSITLLERL